MKNEPEEQAAHIDSHSVTFVSKMNDSVHGAIPVTSSSEKKGKDRFCNAGDTFQKFKHKAKEKAGIVVVNKSDTPWPYKPEFGEGIKYCSKNGGKCVVDGLYTPGGKGGKMQIYKIPDNCAVEIDESGNIKIEGRVCVDGSSPRIVTPAGLNGEFKGWPNPYTGEFGWPEEYWPAPKPKKPEKKKSSK